MSIVEPLLRLVTGDPNLARIDDHDEVAQVHMLGVGGQVLTTQERGDLRRQASQRLALCVDDDRPPFSFVIIEGTVEISDDLDEMLVWATRIGARYMGAETGDAFGRRNAVPGELLVRLRPGHVVAQAGIAD